MLRARAVHYGGFELGNCPHAGRFVRAGARFRKWRATIYVMLFVAFGACWLLPGQAWAADKAYPGLVDGMEILSTYRTLHPEAGQAFEQLMKRVPEDVRKKVQASDWANRQANMTPQQLEDAANNNDVRLMPTGDGLAALSREKLQRGINGLVEFAVDRKETAQLLGSVKDRLPSALQGPVGLIESQLGNLKDSPVQRLLVTGAINRIISQYVTPQIEAESEEIRNAVFGKGGAAAVLAKARQRAAELKEKTKEKAEAAAKAAGNDKEKPDASSGAEAAAAAAAAVRKQTKRELEIAKSNVSQHLSELESLYTDRMAIAARCETAVGKAPDLSVPGSDFDASLRNSVLVRESVKTALERADSVATGAQAKAKSITSTQQAADKVCSGTPAQPAASDKGQLDSMLEKARGTYEGIKGQIDSALAAIAKPVDPGTLPAMRSSFEKKRSYCDANKSIYDTVNAEDLENAHKWASVGARLQETLAVGEHDATELGGDVEIDLLKFRWARTKQKTMQLRDRMHACLERARAIQEQCKKSSAGNQLEKLDRHIAETNALERRRQASRRKLTDLLSRIGGQYTTAKQAVARGRDCIEKASQSANACDAAKIGQAFGGATAEYRGEKFDAAKASLEKIRSTYGKCPGVQERVDKGVAKIDTLINAKTKIASAIAACDANKMASYSGQMKSLSSPHPMMAALIARLDRIVPKVSKASAAYERAKPLYRQGDLAQARAALTEAQAALRALGGDPGCADLGGKIASGLDKITRLDTALGRADAAIKSCSLDEIDALHRQFSANQTHILIRKKAQDLAAAKTRCGTAPDESCRAQFGPAHANKEQSSYKTNVCDCDAGYRWNRDKTRCIPNQKTANAWCGAHNKGSGWFAKNIKADGSYICRQNQAGRNAVCRQLNPRQHVYAGAMRADGSFACHKTRKQRRADAWAECKRRFPRTLIRVERRGNQYYCRHRTGSGGAAAGAIAGAIIQGIISSQGGTRIRRGQPPRRPPRCHRRRDGTIHCGSN